MIHRLFFISLALCITACTASASFLPYRLLPEQPFSDQPFELEVYIGCDRPEQNSQGLGHSVQLTGTQVDVFLVFGPPPPCGVPPSVFNRYDMGTLAAGEYNLSVFRVPITTTFPANPDEFEVELEQTFGVIQSAKPVPTANTNGLLVITMLIMVAGLIYSRKKVL